MDRQRKRLYRWESLHQQRIKLPVRGVLTLVERISLDHCIRPPRVKFKERSFSFYCAGEIVFADRIKHTVIHEVSHYICDSAGFDESGHDALYARVLCELCEKYEKYKLPENGEIEIAPYHEYVALKKILAMRSIEEANTMIERAMKCLSI